MDIIDPSEIPVTKKTQETLRFISKGIDEHNKRNLSPEELQQIREALVVDQIRTSLNIEGIRASSRQTKEVIELFRLKDEIKEGKGNQEIINLQKANDFITSDEAQNSELTLEFILRLHGIVTEGNQSADPGNLRNIPVDFGGIHKPPLPIRLEELLSDLHVFFEASEERDPIVLACWLHNQFTKIHPFKDGNGRLARTLQDWVLYKNNYLPSAAGSFDRLKYLDLLEEADQGEWDDFISHVAQSQMDSLAIANQTVEKSRTSKSRIDGIIEAFTAKKDDSLEQEYFIWREKTVSILESFRSNCQKLDDVPGLGCKFISTEIMPRPKWELIKSGNLSSQNDCFKIYFEIEGETFYKTIGYYSRHFTRNEDSDVTSSIRDLRDKVSIYLGGYDMPPETDYPAKAIPLKNEHSVKFAELPWKDNLIAVREILFYKDKFYKYRNTTEWLKEELISKGIEIKFDENHETWIPENTTPEDVVTEYLRDIFKYKGNLKF
ncbi:Fic family protein [SAR86 cluster bacterium]|nr:Fic family protein [SAR86 cluster bacterium]